MSPEEGRLDKIAAHKRALEKHQNPVKKKKGKSE